MTNLINEKPETYSRVCQIAGLIYQEEIAALLSEEMNPVEEKQIEAVDNLIRVIFSYRFYEVRDNQYASQLWSELRHDRAIADLVITATSRFLALFSFDELHNTIRKQMAYSIALGSWADAFDEDLTHRSLTTQEAESLFESNMWLMIMYMASIYFRAKDITPVTFLKRAK